MKQRILIVEDNYLNQRILHKILHYEYDIDQAYNGAEGWEFIQKHYLELAAVILDLRVPVIDGWELLTMLSEDSTYQNLPILVTTGDTDVQVESQCLRKGAWDFVTKPYNTEVIRLRLHNIIGKSQVELMNQIRMLSERDRLTNLYNRDYFLDRTKKMIIEDTGTLYALVRLDLENFRLYNSSFGSEAGDDLIKRIADGLRSQNREKYIYGRIKSDVFCVCMPYQVEEIHAFMKEIESYVQSFSENYRLQFSFGIYAMQDPHMDMEEMYSCAVEATRECKRKVNCRFSVYDKKLSEQESRYQRIASQMEDALKKEQFHVFLQPKYSIETKKPCGAEALVRWKHPKKGLISPGEFIHVFEKNGQILQLDYYMWERVCVLLQKWIREGKEPYPISVNVSRVSLLNPNIVEEIVNLTEEYDIPRHLLNLEITESAYMSNPDLMSKIISKLREEGFVLLMDDFGSGYSSLNTLKEIQMDILKIDMKFLPSGKDNKKSEKILASVIRMAGWIGMPVIVEGVETRQQIDFLDSIGCSYVQGYYFGRPMTVEAYEDLMEKYRNDTDMSRKPVENMSEELDDIWSSDNKTAGFLETILIPLAVFEYENSQIDVLRVNKTYIEQFGFGNTLNRLLSESEEEKLKAAMEQAVNTKCKAECECLYIMPDGRNSWFRIHLRYLGTSIKTNLVSALFIDITAAYMADKELKFILSDLKKPDQKEASLLIIDDSESSRAILENIFGEEYHILQASDGEEGLKLLRENVEHVSAILLDMVMPKMNGQQFLSCKNEMEEAVGIPVVVISSDASESLQVSMLQNGVNDYVTKPFVPAVVKQRVKNILDYSSRFQTRVCEYREVNLAKSQKEVSDSLDKKGCTVKQLQESMQFMKGLFDVVRLVDPEKTAIITILPDMTISRRPYSCYQIWGKEKRCENCSSLYAKKEHCSMMKYEVLDKEIYYVVSRQIQVCLEDDLSENLVLEVASKISGANALQLLDNDGFKNILEHTREMIYVDPLTKAYNRRYFEDMHFLQKGQPLQAKQVGFIMLDLHRFKQINDLFGYQTGDRVLCEVVTALKTQIRSHDSVIRYGGDEFLIILTRCAEQQLEGAVQRFGKALETVHYGPNDTLHAEADFGYSYAEIFEPDMVKLEEYLNLADTRMYQAKNGRSCSDLSEGSDKET